MARELFRADYKGIGLILKSPQMQQAMKARAEKVMARAVALAPRDSGQYVESFHTEVSVRKGKTTRAVARVVNDSPHAAYVEWGTSRTPRHRVLGRAAGSA